jgi:hypothetical protein
MYFFIFCNRKDGKNGILEKYGVYFSDRKIHSNWNCKNDTSSYNNHRLKTVKCTMGNSLSDPNAATKKHIAFKRVSNIGDFIAQYPDGKLLKWIDILSYCFQTVPLW